MSLTVEVLHSSLQNIEQIIINEDCYKKALKKYCNQTTHVLKNKVKNPKKLDQVIRFCINKKSLLKYINFLLKYEEGEMLEIYFTYYTRKYLFRCRLISINPDDSSTQLDKRQRPGSMVIDDEEPHVKRTKEPYAKLSEIAKANPQKKKLILEISDESNAESTSSESEVVVPKEKASNSKDKKKNESDSSESDIDKPKEKASKSKDKKEPESRKKISQKTQSLRLKESPTQTQNHKSSYSIEEMIELSNLSQFPKREFIFGNNCFIMNLNKFKNLIQIYHKEKGHFGKLQLPIFLK